MPTTDPPEPRRRRARPGHGGAAVRLRPRPARPSPRSPPEAKEPRLFKYAPRRGAARRGRGWAPATAPAQAWRMTSDQAPVFWPFVSAPALPPTGAQMGVDQLSGGSFYCDPFGWVLRDDVPATNPNIFQFAKPGTGKSGTTKAFCTRMMPFGYRTLVLGDPKDEYESLCRALGVEPFVIGPGFWARINPLAMGPLGARLGEALGRGGPAARHDHLQALAGPGPRPGRQHEDRRPAHGARSGPTRATSSATRWQILTGYAAGNTDPARDDHPASCGTCCATPPRSSSGPASTRTPASSSTRPGCCATRSASWSPAPWPASSTTSPTSRSTGAPRSSRSASPGSTAWATRPWASRCCA